MLERPCYGKIRRSLLCVCQPCIIFRLCKCFRKSCAHLIYIIVCEHIRLLSLRSVYAENANTQSHIQNIYRTKWVVITLIRSFTWPDTRTSRFRRARTDPVSAWNTNTHTHTQHDTFHELRGAVYVFSGASWRIPNLITGYATGLFGQPEESLCWRILHRDLSVCCSHWLMCSCSLALDPWDVWQIVHLNARFSQQSQIVY